MALHEHEIDLAQKFSDFVLCVADGKIDREGRPDEILTEPYIRTLYGMTRGRYLPEFGSVELPAPGGRPSIFVIGGGGSGIPVYRALARQEKAFYAGILHENDLDFPIAISPSQRHSPRKSSVRKPGSRFRKNGLITQKR